MLSQSSWPSHAVNACTRPRRACYEARPEVSATPSAQLSGSGLVWNNSNLTRYRFPERQSQVCSLRPPLPNHARGTREPGSMTQILSRPVIHA